MSDKENWELEVSSPFLKKLAWILVVLIMTVHIFMAIVVAVGDTGVTVTKADQWGFIGIGLVFSFVALSLLRPHVKVNSEGVEVRNIVNGQFYPWEIIHGLSFPQEAKWARLELPDFEFVPMMALNIYDKQLIAQRVEDFRQLEDRYMPFDD
ncbi:PH domain-containing protein [Corynebacterium sp. c24Ua_83]|uniref:PH domain-containing protein n=1 Tax=Corynebacterium sp. c24Ua_83 TaxID=3032350 RepID=UPI003264D9B3